MKIYTKTGDSGETNLRGSQRVSKLDLRVETCGSLDELNASLGWVASLELPTDISAEIHRIQSDLLHIGAWIAGLGGSASGNHCQIDQGSIDRIEKSIDAFEKELPPLKNFILPGGSRAAAALHLSRAICRRAELSLLRITGQWPDDSQLILAFVNRLSDWMRNAGGAL